MTQTHIPIIVFSANKATLINEKRKQIKKLLERITQGARTSPSSAEISPRIQFKMDTDSFIPASIVKTSSFFLVEKRNI